MSRFAVTPEWVLDADISDRAVRLYGVISRYGSSSRAKFPSRGALAERLRCSLDSIDRAMKELVDIEALAVIPRQREDGGRSSNEYRLYTDPPAWRTPQDSDTPSPQDCGTPPSREAAAGKSTEHEIQRLTDTPLLTELGVTDPATTLLRGWWDELKTAGEPTPAQPWPAMLQVVRAMLKAGHPENRVAWALRNSPTVSTGALTMAINMRLGKGRAVDDTTSRAIRMIGGGR